MSVLPRSLTILDGVRCAMHREPNAIAVEHRGRSRSYQELVGRAERIGQRLRAEGIADLGRNAVIVSWNCIEYLEVVLGAPDAGLPVATLNPRLTSAEIGAACVNAHAAVVFVDSASATTVREAEIPGVLRVIEFGADYEEWLAGRVTGESLPAVADTEIWTIPYTSGTTGAPKGVLLSHRARIFCFFAMAVEFGCFNAGDRFLAIAPFAHGAGLSFAMASIFFGGFVEIVDRFSAELVLSKLKADSFTGIFVVPTHLHEIFLLPNEVLDANRGSSVRTIICNAAPLPQAMKERVVAYFGPTVLHEVYGSTEGGILTNLRPRDQLRKQRCVGLPLPCVEIRILNESGQECAPEEMGEIFSRAPTSFSGYWNLPDESAAATRDGWVTVGDMGKRDKDGFFYIVDRKKDMVIVGGINVYPREVEEVLCTHPGVDEAAVVGVPDERLGERLRAFVVSRPTAVTSPEELREFCQSRLARYKVPAEFNIIDALPKSHNGKILKRELRDRIGSTVRRGGTAL